MLRRRTLERRDLGASADPRECGQAQLELLGGLPLLATCGLIALQLLITGYAQSLADGAAEAGALAAAAGRGPDPAVRAALPGWAERRVELSRSEGGGVEVELTPPSLLPGIGARLRVRSSAYATGGGGGGGGD